MGYVCAGMREDAKGKRVSLGTTTFRTGTPASSAKTQVHFLLPSCAHSMPRQAGQATCHLWSTPYHCDGSSVRHECKTGQVPPTEESWLLQ